MPETVNEIETNTGLIGPDFKAKAAQLLKQIEEFKSCEAEYGEKFNGFDERLKSIESIATELQEAQKGSAVSIPGLEDELAKREKMGKAFSFINVVRGILDMGWGEGFEKSVLEEAREKAAITSGTGDTPKGGYAIPIELFGTIFPALVTQDLVDKLGVQTLTVNNTVTLNMTRETTAPTASWVAENDELANTNPVLAQFSLTPHRVGSHMNATKLFLNNSIGGAEQYLRNRLFGAYRRALTDAIFVGTGASNQPAGIINISGVTEVELGPDANTGKTMYLGDIIPFEGALQDANAWDDNGKHLFVAHNKVWRKMKSERIAQYSGQTEGAYLIDPLTDAVLKEKIGYNFMSLNSLDTALDKGATSNAFTYQFFFDASKVIVALFGDLILSASDTAAGASGRSTYLRDEVLVKLSANADINIENPDYASFCADVITPTDV